MDTDVSSIAASAKIAVNGNGEFEAVFIRAPIIREGGRRKRKIVAMCNGDPVWVEQGRHMVTQVSSGVDGRLRVHRRFVEKL